MNRHEFLDVASITLSGVFLRRPFFARSLESVPIDRAVAESHCEPFAFEDAGVRGVDVETPAGPLETGYLAWRWLGDDRPTLLFVHGSGEDPFDFGRFSSNSFRRLFATDDWTVPVNLLAIRAPFHGDSTRAYTDAVGALETFVSLLAASATLLEGLRERLLERGCPAVVVSGLSLGGWVVNLHRAWYGTCDHYLPMLAGTATGELFVSSVYRKLVAESALAHSDRIREALDFDDAFAAVDAEDCLPLLARYDRLIEFDEQRGGYEGLSLSVLEKGHVTAALATDRLRAHVARATRDVVAGSAG